MDVDSFQTWAIATRIWNENSTISKINKRWINCIYVLPGPAIFTKKKTAVVIGSTGEEIIVDGGYAAMTI